MSICMQVKATRVQVTLEVRGGTWSPGAGVSDGFVLPKWMVGSKFRFSGRAPVLTATGASPQHWQCPLKILKHYLNAVYTASCLDLKDE